MSLLPFATLTVGDCFHVATTLRAAGFPGHLLRKVGPLHAEYVDGSGSVLVPEGTLVQNLAFRLSDG
jgi:hypothetical protein